MKVAIVMAALLALTACGGSDRQKAERDWRGPEGVVRTYRVTVYVGTPTGLVEGFGHVKARIQPLPSNEQTRAPLLKMDAIPIKLNDGRHVFMLAEGLKYTWDIKAPWTDHKASLEEGDEVPMDPEKYPAFAVFDKSMDPLSYKIFSAEDMSKSLGDGYEVKDIKIKREDHEIVSNLDKIIPWIGRTKGSFLSKEFCTKDSRGVYTCVEYDYFRRNQL